MITSRTARLDRRVLLGFGFSALGNGLSMPYLYVYLADARTLGPAVAGWLFAWMGLVGVAVTPALGILIDRFGPRAVMLGGLMIGHGHAHLWVAVVVGGTMTAALLLLLLRWVLAPAEDGQTDPGHDPGRDPEECLVPSP